MIPVTEHWLVRTVIIVDPVSCLFLCGMMKQQPCCFMAFVSQAVVKVEILRWGNCTCTLGPPVSACGPLVDSCGPQVIIEPQSIYSFTKTVHQDT